IEEIAQFLVGTGRPLPTIVDAGHIRTLDLALEIPDSPLEAVMSAEVWDEVNTRIADLITQHRTTLVFVNTRRLCERLTMHLSERMRSAYPYRDLSRKEFDDVIQMLAEGFTTRRGRRSAHIHYDAINRKIKGRRGARIAAITSGGAIPDLGDYRVILEPTETF